MATHFSSIDNLHTRTTTDNLTSDPAVRLHKMQLDAMEAGLPTRSKTQGSAIGVTLRVTTIGLMVAYLPIELLKRNELTKSDRASI